jgi:hypothetical protein
MDLYIVSTIYQLFNAVNIAESENTYETSTILFVDYGNDIASKIDLTYLEEKFGEVIFADVSKLKTMNKVKRNLLLFKEMFSKSPFNVHIEKQYSRVFISGTEIFSKIIAFKVLERAELFYLEDGNATYSLVLNPKSKYRQDTIFKILYGYRPLDICKGVYVYAPECVQHNVKGVPLQRLENLKAPDRFKNLNLERLFVLDKQKSVCRCIYFESYFDSDAEYELQKSCLGVLCDFLGKENVCVKKHPNEIKRINDDESHAEKIVKNVCFEALNYSLNLQNNILVSVGSSACVTPKLIYNQEPITIYLYKIYDSEFPGKFTDDNESISLYMGLYKNKNVVYTPETMEEFEHILKSLNGMG